MQRYVMSRVFYSGITLVLLSIVIFSMVRITGDPASIMLEYPGAREEDVARLRTQWGLDRPFHVQYLKFAGNVFRGEFGNSFQHALPVRDIYLNRLPNSLQLAMAAFAISLIIGIPFGILSAVKVNTWWDGGGKLFALLGLSVPSFFVALLLILLFGLKLDLLPFFGKGSGFGEEKS